MGGVKTEVHVSDTETRTAAYSECGLYRYSLRITWNFDLTEMAVIALNPSTADHIQDDPTLRRVKAFARDWGYGGVTMLNAFALRSTDPKNLFKHKDPIGPENTIEWLKWMACDPTLAAWGTNITKKPWTHYYRGKEIASAIPGLLCFRKTDSQEPEHPLYLPADLKPIPFSYKE